MQKFIVSILLALGALVPAVAFAQSSSTGLLSVYVQVLNQTGYSNYQQLSPGAFTVNVSGQNPSLTNFPGSQSGTNVTLTPGSYNVTIANAQNGYAPSYSQGCNNTIASGQTQTCVITMSPSYNYYPYPTPYNPYLNQYQPLSCQTVTPNVALGQNATFNAVGGQGGTYNWSSAYQNYPNVGPTLTIGFQSSGSQVVTVTNAAQTATCTVNVSNTYSPTTVSPIYTNTGYSGAYPNYTYTVYPRLPSTGFGPKDLSMGIAFASVLLIAAGIAFTPYVRKTVASISR